MNIFLWILQILLAIHTVMGSVWKFSHSEQTVASLKAIPHPVWTGLSIAELFCALCLVLPALNKHLGILAPLAAVCIAIEMLAFSAIHLSSGVTDNSQMYYWLVVAVICGFLAYGRFVLKPL